ncbi:MAG: hypothetical protein EZS28_020096, partial [Streblomastix strix]
DDLDDDYAEDEEEGDLDTGIENEWMNKILEKTPQLQGNRKNKTTDKKENLNPR